MYKKLTSISIAYKIYIPLIFVSMIGLSAIIYNSYLSLESMEKSAKQEIKKELQSYLEHELNKKFQIGLTNAINLSLNKQIQDALKNNDRNLAYEVLSTISENFNNYSKLENVKIHMHDKNINSFVRSWKYDQFGDNLSNFRYSLNLLHKNKTPLVELESGREGMLVRGISPIYDKEEFLGTIEFIQDFSSLVRNAKKQKNYSIIVLSSDTQNIKKFNKEEVFTSENLLLSQKTEITDQKFYKSIQNEFTQELLNNQKLVKIGDYYVSILELRNIKKDKIGYILIGATKEYVNRYVDDVKEIFINQIWILLSVNTSMLLLLIYLLNIAIKFPIFRLLNSLKNINKELKNKKTPVEIYKYCKLHYDHNDEIGVISSTINILLRTMSRTFLELQKSQRHTSEYIKAIYAGGLVSTSDVHGVITYVNDELCRVTGYTKEELMGQPHSVFRDHETSKQTYEILWEKIKSGKVYNNILKNRRKDGSVFYSNTTIIPIKNEKDEIVEYIAFRDDITELIQSKETLKQTLLIDPLTNLGNRFKMMSDVSSEHYLAVLDVNFFREINDFYGYEIGDKVLKDLGNKLFEYFDCDHIEVYHLNGDEFAVLAHRSFIKQGEFFEMLKTFLAETRKEELYISSNQPILTRLTCGISYDSDNLISFADIAHKHAKKTKKDILEYTNDINTDEEYKKNLEWTSELKKAIDEHRIEAYYQPIVNIKTSKIEKYETLMRLIKEDGTEVSPFFFLDIAKKTRVYKELTKIIVTQAFDKFKGSEYQFSINLSIEDITIYDVGSWIFDLALEKNVNNQVVLEIVESEGIDSFEMVNDFIKRAKEYGMKIAIDDFGTGYSNFEYLIRLNADFIKIDGSLIKDIDTNEKLCGVVETIIAFAKKNSIKVIAEFVSTKEILDKVKQLDADFAQGYYLGKPSKDLVECKQNI